MTLSPFELKLTGNNPEDLVSFDEDFLVHKDVVHPLQKLKEKAQENGFDLRLVSSYRDFNRQLLIWNTKAKGERALLNDQGLILNYDELSSYEVLLSIMRWSALPGFSRHHWGCDFDIYDHNGLPHKDYKIQLTPQEVSEHFSDFHSWLDELIASGDAFGFFRPYDQDHGGIAPEKWHLSFRPTAQEYSDHIDLDFFTRALESELYNELLLKEELLGSKEMIFEKFISLPQSR